MRRSRHKGEKDSSERWLLTYADLITLLMIFFVIMFAMSQVNEVKFVSLQKSLAAALQHSTNIPINLGTTALITQAGSGGVKAGSTTNQQKVNRAEKAQLDQLYRQIRHYIYQHNLQNNVQILNQTRGVQITLRDVVLFDTGQAVLKPQAQGLLAGIVPFLQTLTNPVVVEGYTDNQPIRTSQFPTNWELSSARAIDVVRFLIAEQVSPSRLSGVGYGQYHPVVRNDSPAHRQENRRVNIVVLRNGTVGAQFPQ